MIDAILSLVPVYGGYIAALATFLSCLALPIPSSMVMLTAGAFVASGDLPAASTAAMALGGAIAGDQVGYALGRQSAGFVSRLGPKSAALVDRARALTDRHGGLGVFLSRWLFSPLGPYVNLVAGATRMGWLRFTIWDFLGEAVWVGLYLGTGYAFADQIEAAAELAANFSGVLAAGAVAAGLGLSLRSALRKDRGRRTRRRTETR
jgi:membrane protein DedA with SNARE-associated domain